ncbi:MAG: gliding motility-associated ABC transporter permease subunit GldF [Chitinophagales bacterium]|nr:gliding motility-associated ABC transporter permease subunit GldF [Chitinophagales bacterium]
MWSIYKKELNAFFSSVIGYIFIVVFLLITGFFVWINPDSNVLEYGFASLDVLFSVTPWVFLILIPAITMRSFAEEISAGTIEILATKPIKDVSIILGKYFAAMTLVLFSIVPTFIYFYTVYELGSPKGNLDSGAIWGSYLGVLFLASAFVAVGLFASSITKNQIVSFVLAVSLCFVMHYAFDMVSNLDVFYGRFDAFVQQLGMSAHFISIGRGVIDTRDLTYFLSVTAIFIFFTHTSLESRKW